MNEERGSREQREIDIADCKRTGGGDGEREVEGGHRMKSQIENAGERGMGRECRREERDLKSWIESARRNGMRREVWRWVGRVTLQIGDGIFHLIVSLPFSICVFHLCFPLALSSVLFPLWCPSVELFRANSSSRNCCFPVTIDSAA